MAQGDIKPLDSNSNKGYGFLRSSQQSTSNEPTSDDQALAEVNRHLREIQRLLSVRDNMPEDIFERLIVKEYRQISEIANTISTIRAGLAVQSGTLSQRASADLLNVHSHTLKRWMDANGGLLNEAAAIDKSDRVR